MTRYKKYNWDSSVPKPKSTHYYHLKKSKDKTRVSKAVIASADVISQTLNEANNRSPDLSTVQSNIVDENINLASESIIELDNTFSNENII
jgi:hypothetical protein